MSEGKTSSGKVGFVSLGCPKALVDSEKILTQLRMDGYEVVNSYDNADVVVVNTCGFIDAAKQESLDAIKEAMTENGKVIVTGCMGKGKDAETIKELNPGILAVTGPQAYEEVMGVVHEWVPPLDQEHNPFIDLVPVPPEGVKLTPRHYSYLKISEGCNHSCTFCIIPDMRGKHVSRPVGDVLDEAKRLVAAGTKELLVISQDTSAYGVDTKYRTGFWDGKPVKTKLYDLCKELGEMGAWVRLHYVYPYPSVDDILPLMAEGKILPYLDIPFQHASPRILKLMKRPAHAENTLERIKKWREAVPQLVIRSTFVVGFPGETEEDFQLLLDWLEEAELDRVGCFKYSPVEGAKANDLPDHVPEEIQQERFDRFMQTQQDISARKLQRKIGTRMTVLVDEVDEEGAVARSPGDAPNIDGMVYLNDFFDCQPGDFIEVEIEHADEYDLWGSPVA
ncbi:MAG: 30S ribosomal protein S12 methylthiotransferase RimO [Oceanospirillaceae bacterium]|uniref:30S ribosomal protein S12 methylthiotransferase RimO n=1 Tax=unclassified Thalassolituus TaxID=2624967 RepID=UPI000C09DFAD|nr:MULTISPECIES: 30S ribosomal protein S12 methylthiotransferase RimO [unclassified Thalassolituus]MAK92507.1 30S ribosomal protein S12 methylthiotransferase RimO [Thalassolituus sp.]MAS26260.1 30S ribosomal protein S12 methylthiotransferase RimO [Oceanospirillaceae bacterium]MAX97939.1 30S ribosomal protein S12 methylthiotransferase RimO [Oceanospirillaceae bacterium]MBL33613.1 30S ribosomal protein S12 methylthiotransferase RimO [Oceanospirillaceae bacterium]MBS53881.1 30S ribosomal protein 